jgi:hypothetical protein
MQLLLQEPKSHIPEKLSILQIIDQTKFQNPINSKYAQPILFRIPTAWLWTSMMVSRRVIPESITHG